MTSCSDAEKNPGDGIFPPRSRSREGGEATAPERRTDGEGVLLIPAIAKPKGDRNYEQRADPVAASHPG